MASPPKYVLQRSFDIAPDRWENAKEEIRAILVEKAKQRAMIPYSELVELVKSVKFSAFDQRLFAILGQISVTENEQACPLLSVLVVHKTGDMQAGWWMEWCWVIGGGEAGCRFICVLNCPEIKDGKDVVFRKIGTKTGTGSREGLQGQTRMSAPPVVLNFQTGSFICLISPPPAQFALCWSPLAAVP